MLILRGIRIAGLMLAMSLLLGGCSLERERSFPVSDDWSRGAVVGMASLRQPVAIDADESGTYLVWGARGESGTRLVYSHLGVDGSPVISKTLAVRTLFPTWPQVLVGDAVDLFVVTRLVADERDGVYHMRIDREGELLGEPQRLSSADQTTDTVTAIDGRDGSVHLLWDVVDGPAEGVYHLVLDARGEPQGFPQLIGPNGIQPSGQTDRSGVLHAAWLAQETPGRFSMEYTTIEPGARVGGEPVQVGTFRIPVSDVAQPPTLGLDSSHVYILWSQEHRSGLQQGSAELFYIAFPIGEPALTEPRVAFVSAEATPPYRASSAYPPLTSIAIPGEDVRWTEFIEGPLVVSGEQAGDLKVLADMKQRFRFDDRPQLVLLVFRDGEFVAYQLPARTRQYSMRPRGVIDDDSQLHMAWIDLEDPGNYSVYYASTAPAVRARLNKPTANDTLMDAIDVVWGMASGFSFVPLVGVVAIPVLLVVGIFYITGNDDSLRTSWSAKLTLAITIIIYLGTKILVLAGLITRPPLLGLVPEAFQPAWVWLSLLLVAGTAGLVLWVYIRRSDRPYLFRGVLTYFLVDSLLTLLLYGPTFYSE